jgi:hypothetical protein
LFFPLLNFLKKLQECHLLTDCYLASHFYTLIRLLKALEEANTLIENHKKTGKALRLASQYPALLPAPSECVYNEKIALELSTSSEQTQPSRKKNKKPVEPKNPVPEKKKPKKTRQEESTSTQPAPKNATTIKLAPIVPESAIAIKATPLELLREKLFNLHCAKANIAIRQALWHMDALVCLDRVIKSSSFQNTESLTLLARVASSAHKVLEQSYRFCLEQQKKPLTRIT